MLRGLIPAVLVALTAVTSCKQSLPSAAVKPVFTYQEVMIRMRDGARLQTTWTR
jgi:predicted acyl esterase